MNELSINSIDTNELKKSLYFKSASLILCEGTNRWKVAVNKEQFVYDNVYDLTYCIRHEENKGSSSEINSTNSRLKIRAFLECQFESGRGHH